MDAENSLLQSFAETAATLRKRPILKPYALSGASRGGREFPENSLQAELCARILRDAGPVHVRRSELKHGIDQAGDWLTSSPTNLLFVQSGDMADKLFLRHG
jgi:hypothetical protein